MSETLMRYFPNLKTLSEIDNSSEWFIMTTMKENNKKHFFIYNIVQKEWKLKGKDETISLPILLTRVLDQARENIITIERLSHISKIIWIKKFLLEQFSDDGVDILINICGYI